MTTEPAPLPESALPPGGGSAAPPAAPPGDLPPAPPPPEFSVELSIACPARLSRLLLFVKWLFVIPLQFYYWIYGLVAGVVGLIGLVIVLFTGRYPRGLWDVERRYQERQWKILAYHPFLMTDSWLGKDVTLRVDYPERLSRLLVIGRILLSPFIGLLTIGSWIVIYLFSILCWFTILFTGKLPRDFFNFNLRVLQWQARVGAWSANLRDDWRLFQASKAVWIANLVGVFVLVPLYAYTFISIGFSFGGTGEAETVVSKFVGHGVANDLDAALLLMDNSSESRSSVTALFATRSLFADDPRIDPFWPLFPIKVDGERTLTLFGGVNYSRGKNGSFSAVLVEREQVWKIRAISMDR